MIDLRPAMKPTSDQLNADDLSSGPITIRIREIKDTNRPEQRFWFYFDGDENKPWKPCKGMLRVMSGQWGFDGAKYIGRSLTLYRDPRAKWSGQEVGGIRISHMSDIKSAEVRTVITVSKNKREEYRLRRLEVKKPSTQQNTAPSEPASHDEGSSVDLPAITALIASATLESLDNVAAEVKKTVTKWPRDSKVEASQLLRAHRDLLGAE